MPYDLKIKMDRFNNCFPIKTYKLDSVTVKNKNNASISKINFLYDVINNNYSLFNIASISSRLFLKSVRINEDMLYSFQYHNTENLVNPLSSSLDMQGYYNGSTGLLLSTGYSPLVQNFTHRQTNSNYASTGLIKRITYPTGGYTIFDFESHDCGKYIEHKESIEMYDLYFTNSNLRVGGARIKQIIQSTGDTIAYSYTNNRRMVNLEYQSSGVYLQPYIHEIEYTMTTPLKNIYYYKAMAGINTMYKTASVSEATVGYSQVTETKKKAGQNSGKTVYYFSTHETNPDIAALSSTSNVIRTNNIVSTDIYYFTKQMDKFITYTDNSLERGKLLRKDYYNSSGALCQKEIYKYNDNPDRFQNVVIGVNVGFSGGFGSGVANAYASYYYPTEITEKQICSYFGNDSIVETTNYKYNAKRLLSEIKVVNSNGKTHKTEYKYPYDKATITPYSYMITRNILSPIIEEAEYIDNVFSQKKIIDYKSWGNNVYSPEFVKLQTSNQTSPETRISYHKYDPQGNPIYFIKESTEKIVYLFDSYQYPLAEIKGLSYDEVVSKLLSCGMSNVDDAILHQNTPSEAIRSYLRKPIFSDAFITTFTYKPLVGMTSQTDPRGFTTYYEYDTAGRLAGVYIMENGVKKYVQKQSYHYK
jgi:YD repeat-containing protein